MEKRITRKIGISPRLEETKPINEIDLPSKALEFYKHFSELKGIPFKCGENTKYIDPMLLEMAYGRGGTDLQETLSKICKVYVQQKAYKGEMTLNRVPEYVLENCRAYKENKYLTEVKVYDASNEGYPVVCIILLNQGSYYMGFGASGNFEDALEDAFFSAVELEIAPFEEVYQNELDNIQENIYVRMPEQCFGQEKDINRSVYTGNIKPDEVWENGNLAYVPSLKPEIFTNLIKFTDAGMELASKIFKRIEEGELEKEEAREFFNSFPKDDNSRGEYLYMAYRLRDTIYKDEPVNILMGLLLVVAEDFSLAYKYLSSKNKKILPLKIIVNYINQTSNEKQVREACKLWNIDEKIYDMVIYEKDNFIKTYLTDVLRKEK